MSIYYENDACENPALASNFASGETRCGAVYALIVFAVLASLSSATLLAIVLFSSSDEWPKLVFATIATHFVTSLSCVAIYPSTTIYLTNRLIHPDHMFGISWGLMFAAMIFDIATAMLVWPMFASSLGPIRFAIKKSLVSLSFVIMIMTLFSTIAPYWVNQSGLFFANGEMGIYVDDTFYAVIVFAIFASMSAVVLFPLVATSFVRYRNIVLAVIAVHFGCAFLCVVLFPFTAFYSFAINFEPDVQLSACWGLMLTTMFLDISNAVLVWKHDKELEQKGINEVVAIGQI